MSYKQTMKTGFIGTTGTPSMDLLEIILRQIDTAAELGCTVYFPSMPLPSEPDSLEKLKARIDDQGVELEIQAPRAVFELAGDGSASARKELETSIRAARYLGASILRNGYGRLDLKTSRFNRDIPIQQHLDFLVGNLSEVARIFEDYDMYYAIENHYDFTGQEFVQVFEEVDSSHVGAALDTANGFAVFSDPNSDVDSLAPYAITTRIRDMKVSNRQSELLPFQPKGCVLGDGHVDIPRTLELLELYSPHAEGLHLLVEQGVAFDESEILRPDQVTADLKTSLEYLTAVIKQP